MTAPFSTICVMGLGYIGLPTASLLATKGFRVRGVDFNPAVIGAIQRGEVHIQEPDLDVLVKSAVQSGRLTAHAEPAPADVFILAVPTPFKDGHVPDLSHVESAARAIAPHVKPGNLVILESTSPVGTTERVAEWVGDVCPELLTPVWSKNVSVRSLSSKYLDLLNVDLQNVKTVHLELVDLEKIEISPQALKLVPFAMVRENRILPLSFNAGTLTVAIDDPRDMQGVDNVRFVLNCDVKIVLVKPEQLVAAIKRHYGRPISDKNAEPVYFAHCPERVLPGQILRELIENDRVIGGIDPASTKKARALYKSFSAGKILLTDSRTAEMCKLTENASRDVNIAFANELSLICERLNVDVWELIELANHHPRVKVLQPGPGVGGHCIAVDPWFLVHAAPDAARLIRTAREVNDAKPLHVIEKIAMHASRLKNPVIACLGLAFKADVDDLRESPAVEITRELAARKLGRVLAVEPHVDTLPKPLVNIGVELSDLDTAVKSADILVLLVNHRAFVEIDRAILKEKILIDTRGVWR